MLIHAEALALAVGGVDEFEVLVLQVLIVDQPHDGALLDALGHPADGLDQSGQLDVVLVDEVPQDLGFEHVQLADDGPHLAEVHFGVGQLVVHFGFEFIHHLHVLLLTPTEFE